MDIWFASSHMASIIFNRLFHTSNGAKHTLYDNITLIDIPSYH
jgi:hypothetical protein